MKFTATEEKLEELFSNDQNDQVDTELFKWFMFSLTGKGTTLKNLKPGEFEDFRQRLIVMIDLIYSWQKETESAQLNNIIKFYQRPSEH